MNANKLLGGEGFVVTGHWPVGLVGAVFFSQTSGVERQHLNIFSLHQFQQAGNGWCQGMYYNAMTLT
jgi:hypothetical protein